MVNKLLIYDKCCKHKLKMQLNSLYDLQLEYFVLICLHTLASRTKIKKTLYLNIMNT